MFKRKVTRCKYEISLPVAQLNDNFFVTMKIPQPNTRLNTLYFISGDFKATLNLCKKLQRGLERLKNILHTLEFSSATLTPHSDDSESL